VQLTKKSVTIQIFVLERGNALITVIVVIFLMYKNMKYRCQNNSL